MADLQATGAVYYATAMSKLTQNVDPDEIAKFDECAARWWDISSEFKSLHDINPLRLDYIEARAGLANKRVLDIGCGGGILTEAMARRGAAVVGIDMAEAPLKVAALHLLESGLQVDYLQTTAEQFAEEQPGSFDIITCMEMLEHVPDPASIVAASAKLLRQSGCVFFSTINRNVKAYLFAVVAAEYLLKLLPRGTHDYQHFIRPAELAAWSRRTGLQLHELTGMSYNPLTRRYALGQDIDVNYFAYLRHTDA